MGCTDWVDGVISHAVEVSGEVVNMRRPGKYVMRYDCVDESGKEAEAQFRTVTVVDRTCPQIKIKGVKQNYVEAGFAYVDAGFTATDDLDGVISGKGAFAAGKAGCKTDGNTVNVGQAFYDRRSCKAIKSNCLKGQTCGTGEYYISAWTAPPTSTSASSCGATWSRARPTSRSPTPRSPPPRSSWASATTAPASAWTSPRSPTRPRRRPPSTASAPTPPRAASSRTTPRSARPTCARPTTRLAVSTALATAPRRAASPTRRTAPRPATTRSSTSARTRPSTRIATGRRAPRCTAASS